MALRFLPRLKPNLRKDAHVCPVCNTVTSRSVKECSVCGWIGKFSTDLPTVDAAMGTLIEQCPNLTELLPYQWPGSHLLGRFFAKFRRRRKIDIRA